MRKTMIAAALAAALGAGAAFAHEGHKHEEAKVSTLQGEMLDMACYMAHEGKGAKHAKCAEMCIKGGAPLGLLTTDGKVYLLVNDHGNEKAFAEAKLLAGANAKVTGKVVSRGGVQAIVVAKAVKL